jgi:hypothetical protein
VLSLDGAAVLQTRLGAGVTSGGAENADLLDCSHLGATSSSLLDRGIVRAARPLRKSPGSATLGAPHCRYPSKGKPMSQRRLPLLLVVLLALAALVGCGGGGGKSSSGGDNVDIAKLNGVSIGDCLNTDGNFLVQPSEKVLDGMSPAGVNFTLTLYKDVATAQAAFKKKNPKTTAIVENGVIDFRGNPSPYEGAPPAKISKVELDAIRSCIDKAGS